MMPKLIVLLAFVFVALPAHAEKYRYDAAGRITRVTYDDGSHLDYTYAKSGSVETRKVVAATPAKHGCGCATGGEPGTAVAIALSLAGLFLMRRRPGPGASGGGDERGPEAREVVG